MPREPRVGDIYAIRYGLGINRFIVRSIDPVNRTAELTWPGRGGHARRICSYDMLESAHLVGHRRRFRRKSGDS